MSLSTVPTDKMHAFCMLMYLQNIDACPASEQMCLCTINTEVCVCVQRYFLLTGGARCQKETFLVLSSKKKEVNEPKNRKKTEVSRNFFCCEQGGDEMSIKHQSQNE